MGEGSSTRRGGCQRARRLAALLCALTLAGCAPAFAWGGYPRSAAALESALFTGCSARLEVAGGYHISCPDQVSLDAVVQNWRGEPDLDATMAEASRARRDFYGASVLTERREDLEVAGQSYYSMTFTVATAAGTVGTVGYHTLAAVGGGEVRWVNCIAPESEVSIARDKCIPRMRELVRAGVPPDLED